MSPWHQGPLGALFENQRCLGGGLALPRSPAAASIPFLRLWKSLNFFEDRAKCSPGYLEWHDSPSELMKNPRYTSVFRLKVPCGRAFISRLTFIRQINTKGKLETDKRNLCNLGQYWLSLTCYFKTIWELDSFLEYISKILSTVFLRPDAKNTNR